MGQALDTSKLYLLVEGTETVTLQSRATESTFTGISVPYAKRITVTADETDGLGLKRQKLAWHLWTDNLGAVVPKVNDVIADAVGDRWDVTSVTPQRFRQRFRLETTKEV